MKQVKELVKNQREFFYSQKTLPVKFRKEQLEKLYAEIKKNEKEILRALKQDLNKSEFEGYATELGIVYEEIRTMIKHVKKLAKPKMHKTPIVHFPSTTYTHYDPFGCVLIMSPWNYPFQLAMNPLIGAIAAGNCVLVKPSNYSPATSSIIKKLLSIFDENYIGVVEGGRDVNTELLEQKFDYIFFTGSPVVGHLVMEKAAKYLTPITLELGGKSPCIVDKTAKIDLTAKRITWGKLLNSSQTCVAPDYILVHESVKNELVAGIKKWIKIFYGENPHENSEYPKIINQHHFNRISALIESSKNDSKLAVSGGSVNSSTLQIEPTIVENATWESAVMQEELFGPIFPIIPFTTIDEAIQQINANPKPLALYLFTTAKEVEQKVLTTTYYGGGCINDTIIHLANSNVPFGGVGNSGMGKYHGKESFYTFSHTKSILKKGNWLDVNIRYAPYNGKMRLLKMFLK